MNIRAYGQAGEPRLHTQQWAEVDARKHGLWDGVADAFTGLTLAGRRLDGQQIEVLRAHNPPLKGENQFGCVDFGETNEPNFCRSGVRLGLETTKIRQRNEKFALWRSGQ